MLILLSPAKKLDFETPPGTELYTQPRFIDQSQKLINKLKRTSGKQLRALMDISQNLATLNIERYASWLPSFSRQNSKQAMYAFNGDVYAGLDPASYTEEDIDFAQNHLRILSGLHGVLRPLDLIQPYRLEMGTQLPVGRKKNLYQFWKENVAGALKEDLSEQGDQVIVNLASNEYFKVVDTKKVGADIITPNFKEYRKGKLTFVSFTAKKARGWMASYIIKNRVSEAEEIKGFDWEGYTFNTELSTEREWLFTREM